MLVDLILLMMDFLLYTLLQSSVCFRKDGTVIALFLFLTYFALYCQLAALRIMKYNDITYFNLRSTFTIFRPHLSTFRSVALCFPERKKQLYNGSYF